MLNGPCQTFLFIVVVCCSVMLLSYLKFLWRKGILWSIKTSFQSVFQLKVEPSITLSYVICFANDNQAKKKTTTKQNMNNRNFPFNENLAVMTHIGYAAVFM